MADQFDLGRHEALLETMDKKLDGVGVQLDRLNTRVTGIELHLAEQQGEEKSKHRRAAGIGGLAGSAITALAGFVTKVWLAHHGG